jgi:hypothetical protein
MLYLGHNKQHTTKEKNMFTVWFENCEDFGSFDSLDAAKAFVAERLEDCDWLVEDQFDIVENDF